MTFKIGNNIKMIAGPHKGKSGVITAVSPRKAERYKNFNGWPYYFHVLIDDKKIIQTVKPRMEKK